MSGPLVDLVVEEDGWLDHLPGLQDAADTGAAMALTAAGLDPAAYEIAVLACGDARMARLNADHRGKPVSTNVLSWPAFELSTGRAGGTPSPPPAPIGGTRLPLGDVAIALQTCVAEAESAALPLKTHATHLILHSVLHLLGYDHQTDADAELMEGMESRAMISAGFDDPYETERSEPRATD